MYNIISETIFEGNKKAASLSGYIDLGEIINEIFSCDNLPQCCNETGVFIKRADLLFQRSKPKNNYISLDKIIKDIYNCCESTTLCKSTSKSTYWINSGVIRPKKTIETVSFDKVIKKAFKCCGITDCNC